MKNKTALTSEQVMRLPKPPALNCLVYHEDGVCPGYPERTNKCPFSYIILTRYEGGKSSTRAQVKTFEKKGDNQTK